MTALREPVHIRFVLEQHLGHRTYSANILEAARERDDVRVDHVPVTYDEDLVRWAPARVRGTLAGRGEVRHALRSERSDVDVFNTQVPAALAGRALTAPYVVVTDVTPAQYDSLASGYGHRPDRRSLFSWFKHRVNRRVFGEAAFCVGWSEWVARSLRDDYGVAAERIRVIPVGVDLERWQAPPRPERDRVDVLFVGGDFERKGGPELVAAVRDLGPDVHLTVVTRERLELGEQVTVINDLGPNDPRLIALYHAADVFALPSRAETFGIAVVEAAAAGLPVIATRIGAFADIVDHGVTGLLVSAGDADGVGEQLAALVADPERRRRMGVAAAERAARRFDARRNAGALVDLAIAAAGGTPTQAATPDAT